MSDEFERVKVGAALLDKAMPGWWDGQDNPTIDLTILDMNSHSMCVLGQCFGDYVVGCAEVGVSRYADKGEGFTQETAGDYEELTEAWRQEIQQRRDDA